MIKHSILNNSELIGDKNKCKTKIGLNLPKRYSMNKIKSDKIQRALFQD